MLAVVEVEPRTPRPRRAARPLRLGGLPLPVEGARSGGHRMKRLLHQSAQIGLVMALGLAALLAVPAWSQLQTGNLYGTTVDEQGAALPGVTVTVAGVGAPIVQVTDAQGRFRFVNLTPDAYSLSAA